jgi:hypothetical protein
MANISQSVGSQAANQQNDVRIVQALLNQYAGKTGAPPLKVDGQAGVNTVAAIKLFQLKVAGMALADGRVEPGGRTWNTLAKDIAKPSQQLSGATWWHANQARFPNSADLSTLDIGFRQKVDKFLAAMRAAGLKVQVRSTRRSKVRAYLMHYSWKLAKGQLTADKVPPEPGCDIVWDHGNPQASKLGAQQMVDLFNVVYQPSLNSRHINGLAIDMDIGWAGQAKMRDSTGKDVNLGMPQDGTNTTLHQVGKGYGVIKNVADRPHWSDNGH